MANCDAARYQFTLIPTAAIVGVPIANSQIQVNATKTKIRATGVSGNEVCETYLFPVSQFQWTLISPQGQNATILNPNSLAPNIRLAGPGIYTLRLVVCPNECSFRIESRSKRAGPFRHDFRVTAAQDITVPPEYEPPTQDLLPVSPANPPLKTYTKSERSQKCNGGGGVKDPQWVTAEDFTGSASYTLLEGTVTWSKVADLDNPLNHDTQDFEWKNKPDLPYAGLPTNGAETMKTEWESGRYPRIFNPTPGDRTSTFGFLIFDCGHDPYKNEIHPPIGVATHRARPIHVPPSFRPTGFPNGFGQNVFVPGIASDLWFNRRSGETTRNCSRTGLHNPAKRITVQGQQTPINRIGSCIREPHPLGRTFNYRIYLPRNPRLRALELGMTSPPNVPLFVNVEKFSEGGGGPFPAMVFREVNGVSFLDVTIDLRGFAGGTYGRRISAGWAYPSPDNWGLNRWRVFLDDMYIYDDAEPGFDDGDWRVFFNTNNRDQEWSKILECDGCVDDDENRRLNLATGPGGTLGPDIPVFPDQPIYIHTVGYDDEVAADDLGSIFDKVPQRLGSYKTNASNGEAAYRLEYRVRPAGAVKPTLSREAGALFAAYTGRPNPSCQLTFAPVAAQKGPTGAVPPFCAPARQDTTLAMSHHPLNLDIKRPLRLSKVEFDEPMEEEEFALTGISTKELRRVIRSLSRSERGKLFKELRQVLDVPRRRRDMVQELVKSLDRSLSDRLFRQAVPRPLR